jgi:hypothetical protein
MEGWMRKLFAALVALSVPVALLASPVLAETSLRAPQNSVSTYILLDRTGSMSDRWAEALSSVNAYAVALGEDEAPRPDLQVVVPKPTLKTSVTLAVFDAQDGLQFDVLRRGVDPHGWKPVTSQEASPRGMTPLFDAMGQMMALAEKDNPKKAVIVIMTDGAENASREMTKLKVKASLDRARERGWEVVFLGADFSNFADASGVGVTASKSIAVDKSALSGTMQRLAKKSRDYGQSAAPAPVTFDAEDRKVAKEDQVKQKQNR